MKGGLSLKEKGVHVSKRLDVFVAKFWYLLNEERTDFPFTKNEMHVFAFHFCGLDIEKLQ